MPTEERGENEIEMIFFCYFFIHFAHFHSPTIKCKPINEKRYERTETQNYKINNEYEYLSISANSQSTSTYVVCYVIIMTTNVYVQFIWLRT